MEGKTDKCKVIVNGEKITEIEERTKGQFAKDKEEIDSTLEAFQMEYDEFLKFHIAKIKRLEIETKWTLYINDAIRKGELNTENKEFNKKCKQSRENKTESQDISLLFKLVDEYKEYLTERAQIKYID